MKNTSALARTNTAEQTQTAVSIPYDVAQKIALSWMDTQCVENALIDMGTGIAAVRAAPAAQNAAAAIAADMIDAKTRITVTGFQPHGWMVAQGSSIADVACIYLGKKMPRNVTPMTVEDVSASFVQNQMTIVALHIESSNGWNDVRTISAAAVKAETPMLMIVSTAVPAPEGVTINVAQDWNTMASAVRDAVASVRKMGTIRVVAIDDMTNAVMEPMIMEMAGMSPEAWAGAVQKNNDGAELAMNIAYQAPVESF